MRRWAGPEGARQTPSAATFLATWPAGRSEWRFAVGVIEQRQAVVGQAANGPDGLTPVQVHGVKRVGLGEAFKCRDRHAGSSDRKSVV